MDPTIEVKVDRSRFTTVSIWCGKKGLDLGSEGRFCLLWSMRRLDRSLLLYGSIELYCDWIVECNEFFM